MSRLGDYPPVVATDLDLTAHSLAKTILSFSGMPFRDCSSAQTNYSWGGEEDAESSFSFRLRGRL